MKIHIDKANKTVQVEGEASLSELFTCLMNWFSEDWEQWKLIPFVRTNTVKEVIIEKSKYPDWWGRPYQDWWVNPIVYTGTTLNQKDILSADMVFTDQFSGNDTSTNNITFNIQ